MLTPMGRWKAELCMFFSERGKEIKKIKVKRKVAIKRNILFFIAIECISPKKI